VPTGRFLNDAGSAQYLGKAIGTIRKLTDLNVLQARAELNTSGQLRAGGPERLR